MVEFGLKLEDNKVDEWSSQYIDYEKLKAILKKAKVSATHRDDILKRMPAATVAEVVHERRDRSTSDLVSRGTLISSPTNTDEHATPMQMGHHHPFELSSAKNSSSSLPVATDSTPLLSSPLMKRTTSWGNLGLKVTSYLGLADDKALLMQAYDNADNSLSLFRVTYDEEVKKVRDFYQEKTDEIEQRMEVLLESVDTSGLKIKPKKEKHSLVESITQRFESMMHKHTNSLNTLPDFQFSISLDDDDQLEQLSPVREERDVEKEKKDKKGDRLRQADSIKRAITDIYRTSKLLHNYSIMNYTGFVKIAKKFDKTFPEHKGVFKGNNCDDGKQAELLAAKMEKIYSKWFCDGDVREAQAQMLPKRGDGLMMDWTQLRLGYRLGMCSILAMWVAWDCVWGQFAHGEVSIGGRSAFPVFRACFGLLAWHWFWGMAVYVWTRFRINYIYLFDFDPRNVDTPVDIFNDAVDETLVFLVCMLMYYKADVGDMPLWIPPRLYPTFLIIYTCKCLIFPWKMRKPLWVAIRQVFLAPFVSPTFFLTYVGDVFTSMVKLFQDILWSICFLVSGDFLLPETEHEKSDHIHSWSSAFWYKNVAIPLICLFPLWLRFNQCLRRYLDTGKRVPNLPNALKYAMSQSVTLFGAFHPLYLMHSGRDEQTISMTDDSTSYDSDIVIGRYRSNFFQFFWMGLFIITSLYSFCWDVYMDWKVRVSIVLSCEFKCFVYANLMY